MSASKRQRTHLCIFSNVLCSKHEFGNTYYAPFPKTVVRKISAESYWVTINTYQPNLNTNFGCKSYTDAKIPKIYVFYFVKNVLLWDISNMYLSGEILQWAPKPYLLKRKKKHLEMLRGQWWQAPGVPTEDPTQRQSSKCPPSRPARAFPWLAQVFLQWMGELWENHLCRLQRPIRQQECLKVCP